MKEKLDPVQDVLAAQMVIRAAYDGNLDFIREAIEAGAGTSVFGSDVPYPEFNGIDPRSVGFHLTAHEHLPDEPLNAALYAAAYFGHTQVVEYLINLGDLNQKSLDVALIAAAHLNDPHVAASLIAAGADTRYDGHRAIECALACMHMRTARVMLDICPDTDYVLAVEIVHGKDTDIARALDRKPDPLPALKKLCSLLNDRNTLRNRVETTVDTGLDKMAMLLAYAEAVAGEKPEIDHVQIAATTMQCAVNEWASPVIDRIAGYAAFYEHADAQKILDSALSRTAFSLFSGFDLAYKDHETLCRKLLGCGASPQALLPAAAERGIRVLAEMASESGADPRFSRIEEGILSPIAIVSKKMEQFPDDNDFVQVSEVFNRMAARLDLRDQEAFQKIAARGLDARALRAAEVGSNTGLMLAAIAGKTGSALGILAQDTQEPLVAADVFARAGRGLSLLDILETRGETALLFEPRLWYGRVREFSALAENIEALVGKKYADHIENTLATLASEESRQMIRKTTRQRFKMGYQ